MMNIYLPVGMIAAFISLFYFYSFHKRRQAKKANRAERISQLKEELLNTLRENPNNAPDADG